jgi:hypothetical protein
MGPAQLPGRANALHCRAPRHPPAPCAEQGQQDRRRRGRDQGAVQEVRHVRGRAAALGGGSREGGEGQGRRRRPVAGPGGLQQRGPWQCAPPNLSPAHPEPTSIPPRQPLPKVARHLVAQQPGRARRHRGLRLGRRLQARVLRRAAGGAPRPAAPARGRSPIAAAPGRAGASGARPRRAPRGARRPRFDRQARGLRTHAQRLEPPGRNPPPRLTGFDRPPTPR